LVVILSVTQPSPAHAANWLLTHVAGRYSEEAKQLLANIEKFS
jgi:hypothetical protein